MRGLAVTDFLVRGASRKQRRRRVSVGTLHGRTLELGEIVQRVSIGQPESRQRVLPITLVRQLVERLAKHALSSVLALIHMSVSSCKL